MKKLYLWVVGLLAFSVLALVPTSAHATSGSFDSSLYWSQLWGRTQASIQSSTYGCGCTPAATNSVDGNDKDVTYVADNGSFAWNVSNVAIHYHYFSTDGTWKAVDANASKNYDSNMFPNMTGKARIGDLPCNPGCGSVVFDDINALA